MASKRAPGSRPGLVHCDRCGEDYASTYRRCPFCDDEEDYEEDYETAERAASRSGGKRLAQSKRRGGGYTKVSPLKILSILISLAVILAAVWIVVTQLLPLIQRGENVGGTDLDSLTSQSPGGSEDGGDDGGGSPAGSGAAQTSGTPGGTAQSGAQPSDGQGSAGSQTSDDPAGGDDPAGVSGGAAGFSLSTTDFSFNDRYPDPVTIKVTFTPEGTSAVLTWSSSNPDVAAVDENGKVSPGSRTGSATITAAMDNGVTQSCKVYNQISGGSSAPDPEPEPSVPDSGSYEVNNPDFTFYNVGESYRVRVNDYTGGVSWSSSDTSVATVSGDGTCTAVGSGTCTVTGTLDNGATVKAIVRVRLD